MCIGTLKSGSPNPKNAPPPPGIISLHHKREYVAVGTLTLWVSKGKVHNPPSSRGVNFMLSPRWLPRGILSTIPFDGGGGALRRLLHKGRARWYVGRGDGFFPLCKLFLSLLTRNKPFFFLSGKTTSKVFPLYNPLFFFSASFVNKLFSLYSLLNKLFFHHFFAKQFFL